MGLILEHLRDAALAAALIGICTALGIRLLDWTRATSSGRPFDLIVGVCLGFGVLATSILIVGFVLGVSPLVLGLTIAVLASVAAGAVKSTVRRTRIALSRLRRIEPWSLGLFGLVAVFLFVQSTTPVTDWDALMYHLEIPRRFLAQGRIHVPLDNLHVAFVGLPHMLYLPLLAFGGPAATQILEAWAALMLGLAALSIGRRVFGPRTGTIAMPLVYACTMIPLVAITPRVDVLLALFLLVGHGALLDFLSNPERDKAVITGALLGFAVGVKYPALAYTAALVPVALLAFRGTLEVPETRRAILGGGIVFLLAAAPWLLKNVILLGAPLYPFLAETQLPPWLANLYSETGAPVPGEEMYRALLEVRAPLDLRSLFLDPGRLTVEGEGAYYYLNPLFLLLPLALLDPRRREMAAVAVPALLYFGAVALFRPTTNLRYLIPALPALTIVVAAVIDHRAGRKLAVVLTILALIPTGIAVHHWMTTRPALGHLVGVTSSREYMREHPDPGVRMLIDLRGRLEEIARPGGRALLLFEARGYGFDIETLQDNLLVNWPLLESLLDGKCDVEGAELPFEYVVLNIGALNYYVGRGLEPGLLHLEDLSRFTKGCLRSRYTNPGFILFERRGVGASRDVSG